MILVAGLALMFIVAVVSIINMRPKCPRCGGKMINLYYDAEIDHNVYKCEDCGKEWI